MIVQTTFHVLEVRISMYVGRSEVIQAIKFLTGLLKSGALNF